MPPIFSKIDNQGQKVNSVHALLLDFIESSKNTGNPYSNHFVVATRQSVKRRRRRSVSTWGEQDDILLILILPQDPF